LSDQPALRITADNENRVHAVFGSADGLDPDDVAIITRFVVDVVVATGAADKVSCDCW
jgi:hypothetical protein